MVPQECTQPSVSGRELQYTADKYRGDMFTQLQTFVATIQHSLWVNKYIESLGTDVDCCTNYHLGV